MAAARSRSRDQCTPHTVASAQICRASREAVVRAHSGTQKFPRFLTVVDADSAHPGQHHRARSGEGAEHAGRAVDTCYTSRERGMAIRARTKQPVSSELPPPTVRRGRGLVLVGALHIVCMCGEARPIEATVLVDRFTSRTSRTAHLGRSGTPQSTRDAKSEQSVANHVCNTPTTCGLPDTPRYS